MQDYFDSYDGFDDDDDSDGMPASIFSLTPPEFEEVEPLTEEELERQDAERARQREEELKAQEEFMAQEELIRAQEEQMEKEQERYQEDADSMATEDIFDKLDSDCAVKKYIFAVSRDYSSTIDLLSLDARSAFINEAICLKIEKDQQNAKKEFALNVIRHIILVVLTVIIGVPVMFILVNKSIDSTHKSYEYIQSNFEKLYKDKAEKDALLKKSGEIAREKKLIH